MASPWAKSLVKQKYGAQKTTFKGEGFHSKLEAEVYATLLLLVRVGELSNIRRQQSVKITPSVTHKIDFVVFDEKRGCDVGVEAKGFETERFKVLEQLYGDLAPMPIQIWKKKGSRLFCFKEIPIGKYQITLKT